jgi:hypothetical protein
LAARLHERQHRRRLQPQLRQDRARAEYALGSARESRDWYYKSRHVLTELVVEHRVDLCSQIIRLLLTMLPDERHRTLKEDPVSYEVDDSA